MKKNLWTLLKMIITMLIIFITPFILPLILKLFISWKWFSSIDEFEKIIKIFYNMYPIVYIMITVILLLWFFHKWEDIKKIFMNAKFSLKFNGMEIQKDAAEDIIRENEKKQELIENLKTQTKSIANDSKISKQEIKEELFNKTSNLQCESCNKNDLEEENKNLKYYAAYNIINIETKSLLHIIYNEKYIETEKFKNTIIEGYTKRNRHNKKFSKKDINKIADSKYKAIYEGLKFLNIIEPSEDDKDIKLTNEGKEFVEKYIEEVQNDGCNNSR